MSLALSPSNLKVYRDILGLVWRHGNREALDAIGIGKLVDKVREDNAPGPADLAKDLETLGPTYIKIGQILSTQLNVLPPAYMEAMARLQDHVEPLAPEVIHRLIEEAFGKPASEVFAEFDEDPLGSASISQVHRAVTHQGEVVAVKIQRPNAKQQIARDFDALAHVAETIDGLTASRYELEVMLDHTRGQLELELDFNKEAANLQRMAELLADTPEIRVPRPHLELSSERVLTMEFIAGDSVAEAAGRLRAGTPEARARERERARASSEEQAPREEQARPEGQAPPVEQAPPEEQAGIAATVPPGVTAAAAMSVGTAGIDGAALAQVIFKKYLEHILVEGFFHGDPHPGNVLLDEENRLVLLDLGMVGRVDPRMRERLLQLVLGIVDGRGEQVADVALQIGAARKGCDQGSFKRQISGLVLAKHEDRIDGLRIGEVVLAIARLCGEERVSLPPVLTTIGKTLLNLDQLGQSLDPRFDPSATIRAHTWPLVIMATSKALSPTDLIAQGLGVKRFLEVMPARLDRLLENLSREDRGIKIDAIDENRLIAGVEKVANRVSNGVMVASFFIAGALIMNVRHPGPMLFGMPVLSLLLFSAGVVGMLVILGAIALLRDRGSKQD